MSLICRLHSAEWEVGRDICVQLFRSEDTATRLADTLCNLAMYHGINSWLINIENEIPPGLIGNVGLFLRKLKEGMANVNTRSAMLGVMWYKYPFPVKCMRICVCGSMQASY